MQLYIKPNGHGPTNTTLNPTRMRNHLHAALIRAISNIHPGTICNEGADACARTAALMVTMDITLPDARDLFHNFYGLSLKSLHGRNDDPHLSEFATTH
eukprot:1158005-Pelagomonas_calceolata.AAC.8